MEQKEQFINAMTDALNDYPFSDEKTVMRHIRERAKGMSNNNERARQVKFTELPKEYSEAKKSHTALKALAGVAGTAAVLTGAFFGLKFLNDHGGLKGPDVRGAGYHEDVAEKMSANVAEEAVPENVFEFDGIRAVVDWWQFDGKTLKLQYDIDFGDKRCEDIDGSAAHRVTPIGDFEASTTLDIFEQKENSIKMRATIELFNYADRVSLNFIDNKEYARVKQGEIEAMSPDAYRELEVSLIDMEKTSVQYASTDFAETEDPAYPFGYRTGRIVVTATEVSFELLGDTDPSEFEDVRLSTVDFDGNETEIGKGAFVTNDNGGILAFPTNGIDIDVAKVFMYSLRHADSIKPVEIEASGKAVNGVVPMDETVELDDVSVHFTGYEFDTSVVTFYYDIIGTTRMDIRPMGINGAVFNGTSGTQDEENNMVKGCHGRVALYEPADTARISFGRDLIDLTDKSYTTDDEAFAVTVHSDPDSVIQKAMLGNVEDEEKVVVCNDALVTPTHVTACLNRFYKRQLDDIRDAGASVVLQNGNVIKAHIGSTITADDGSDLVWIVREFDEPIDISEVSEVWFDECRMDGMDIPELNVGSSFTMSDGTIATIVSAQFDGFVCKIVYDIHSDDTDYFNNVFYTAQNGVETWHLKILAERMDGVPDGATMTVPLSSDDNGCTVRVIEHFLPTDENDGYPIVRKVVDCSGIHNNAAGYITIPLTEQADSMISTTVSDERTGDREIDISPLGFRIHQQNSDYDLYANSIATVTYTDGTVREIPTYTGGWYSLVSDEQLLDGTFDESLDLSAIYSIELYDSTVILDRNSDTQEKIPEEITITETEYEKAE